MLTPIVHPVRLTGDSLQHEGFNPSLVVTVHHRRERAPWVQRIRLECLFKLGPGNFFLKGLQEAVDILRKFLKSRYEGGRRKAKELAEIGVPLQCGRERVLLDRGLPLWFESFKQGPEMVTRGTGRGRSDVGLFRRNRRASFAYQCAQLRLDSSNILEERESQQASNGEREQEGLDACLV